MSIKQTKNKHYCCCVLFLTFSALVANPNMRQGLGQDLRKLEKRVSCGVVLMASTMLYEKCFSDIFLASVGTFSGSYFVFYFSVPF